MQFEFFAIPEVGITIAIVLVALSYLVYYLAKGGMRDLLLVKYENSVVDYRATRDGQVLKYNTKSGERQFIVRDGDVFLLPARFGKQRRLTLGESGKTHTTRCWEVHGAPDTEKDKKWLQQQILEDRVVEQHTAGMQLTLKKQMMGIFIGLGFGLFIGLIAGLFLGG